MAVARRKFRPMGFGDILDEAFDLYKTNFALLVGTAAVLYVPFYFIFGAAMARMPGGASTTSPEATASAIATGIGMVVIGMVILFFVYPVVTGALSYAVSQRYLGETTGVGDSYKFILSRLGAVIWTVLLYGLAAYAPLIVTGVVAGVLAAVAVATGPAGGILLVIVLVPLLIASMVVTIFLGIRLSATPAALIVEGARYSAALKRSWALTAGHGWRIFGIYVVSTLVLSILSYIITLPAGMAATGLIGSGQTALGTAIAGAAQAIAQTLLSPVLSIVLILLYYDLRIRKEGFDLQMLAQNLAAASGLPPAQPAPGVAPQTPAATPTDQTYPRCAYCRFPIYKAADSTTCGSCQAVLHTNCWTEHGGCTTPGCPAAPAGGQGS